MASVAPDLRSEVLAEFESAQESPARLRRGLPPTGAGLKPVPDRWYRLELDAEGKVVSCKAVDHAEHAIGHVVFIRARSEEDAQRKAWNVYLRVRNRRQREQWAAAGLCRRCGRSIDGYGVCCSLCQERSRIDTARSRARARGTEVPDVPAPRREVDAKQARLDVLREVHEAFTGAQEIDEFIEWIEDEIGKLAPPTEAGTPPPAPVEPAPVPRRRDALTIAKPRAKSPAPSRKIPPAPAWMAHPLRPPGK